MPAHMTSDSRADRVSRLAARFERSQAVRLTMLLVVSFAATAGFLTSVGLLWAGVSYMPIRYTLACVVGYGLFLALMHRWLGSRANRTEDQPFVDAAVDSLTVDVPVPSWKGTGTPGGVFEGGRSGGGGASAAFAPSSSVPSSPGWTPAVDDEGLTLLPVLAVGAIAIGLLAVCGVVWSAPQLIAEVLVDGAIAGGAYRRLRQSTWTGGIVRRTWKPMLALAVVFVVVGFAGHYFKPGSDSIGDLFRSVPPDVNAGV